MEQHLIRLSKRGRGRTVLGGVSAVPVAPEAAERAAVLAVLVRVQVEGRLVQAVRELVVQEQGLHQASGLSPAVRRRSRL